MFGKVAVGPTHGIMIVVALVKELCQFQPLAEKADLGLNMVQTIITMAIVAATVGFAAHGLFRT